VAAKGFARANIILKCFYSKDRNFLCKLFITYVRPILEYNLPVWSPHFTKDVKTVERVQRYFTRNLKDLSSKTYSEHLTILNLPSLQCRRVYSDLVFLFKIIHGLTDNTLRTLVKPNLTCSNIQLRRHTAQLHIPKPRSDTLKYSFLYRSIKRWNSLPANICTASSISAFKLMLMPY
jgi:hypothetical protein